MITLLILFYLCAQCTAHHNVRVNNAFEFDTYNDSQWSAIFKRADCARDDKKYLTHSCNTANLANVRLVDGNLVINAIEQGYFDSKYTTASVHLNVSDPKPHFNLKKGTLVFRLRAALPLLAMEGLTPKIIVVFGVDTGNSDANQFFSMNLLNFVTSAQMTHSTNLAQYNEYEIGITDHDVRTLINDVAVVTKTINEPIFLTNSHNMSILGIAINVVIDENKVSRKTHSFADVCTSFVLDYLTYHYSTPTPSHSTPINTLPQSNQSQSTISHICKVVKQSDRTFIKFVPNENYTQLLHEYTFDNMTTLDRQSWVYRDNKTMDRCDGVQPFHMQYEAEEKKQGKLFSCDPATFQIKQGTLRVMHSGHADMRTAIATKADFSNVRIEIKARPPTTNLFGSFHLHDDHRQYQHIGEEFELRQRAETKHKGRYEGWVEVARLFGGGDVKTVLQLSKTYHIGSEVNMSMVDSDGWVVFGIEWTEDYIIWFIKDQVIFQTNRLRDQEGNHLVNIDEYVSYLPFEFPFRLYILVGTDYRNLTNRSINYTDDRPWVEIEYIKVYGKQPSKPLAAPSININMGTIGVGMLIVALCAVLSATLVVLKKTKSKLLAKNMDSDYDDIGIQDEHLYKDIYEDYLHVDEYSKYYTEIPDDKVSGLENADGLQTTGTIKHVGNHYLPIKYQVHSDDSQYCNLYIEPSQLKDPM